MYMHTDHASYLGSLSRQGHYHHQMQTRMHNHAASVATTPAPKEDPLVVDLKMKLAGAKRS